MKKKTSVLASMLLISQIVLAGTYSGGTGEPDDPYRIATAEDMQAIGANPDDWDKHFKLMADIDLSRFIGADFNFIGYYNDENDNEPFTGVFNGNGHTISNFTCDYVPYRTYYLALFGYVGGGGEIKDLGLEDVNINIGTNAASLVGINEGTLSSCYATGLVEAEYVYAVGGLVAANRGMISACYFAGSVSVVQGRDAGGLAGFNGGTVSTCYAAGSVTGNRAGGLVGYNGGVISDCYARGSVIGTAYAGGGLVGFLIGGEILNCYAAGPVTGVGDLGGLLGNLREGSIENSFYDKQTTGQSSPSFGLTTAQMQMRSTFTDAGWDFVGETANGTDDIWDICEGTNYPRLVWQVLPGNLICPDSVDMFDLAHLGDWWLESCNEGNNYCDRAEISGDETVDFKDFAVLANNWLEEY